MYSMPLIQAMARRPIRESEAVPSQSSQGQMPFSDPPEDRHVQAFDGIRVAFAECGLQRPHAPKARGFF